MKVNFLCIFQKYCEISWTSADNCFQFTVQSESMRPIRFSPELMRTGIKQTHIWPSNAAPRVSCAVGRWKNILIVFVYWQAVSCKVGKFKLKSEDSELSWVKCSYLWEMAFTIIPCRVAYNRRTGGLVIGWVNFIFYIVALISFYIYKHPKSTDESKATLIEIITEGVLKGLNENCISDIGGFFLMTVVITLYALLSASLIHGINTVIILGLGGPPIYWLPFIPESAQQSLVVAVLRESADDSLDGWDCDCVGCQGEGLSAAPQHPLLRPTAVEDVPERGRLPALSDNDRERAEPQQRISYWNFPGCVVLQSVELKKLINFVK